MLSLIASVAAVPHERASRSLVSAGEDAGSGDLGSGIVTDFIPGGVQNATLTAYEYDIFIAEIRETLRVIQKCAPRREFINISKIVFLKKAPLWF